MKNLIYKTARKSAKIEEKKEPERKDRPVTTYHTLQVGGVDLGFSATCGYLDVKLKDDKPDYRIFFTYYAKSGKIEPGERPITFCFNGGPGASSAWLHFGALGPKRVKLTDKGNMLRPPGRIVDNEFTWLPFTDLVFIDPVGAGYSRPIKDAEKKESDGGKNVEEKKEKAYSYEGDVDSVGEFVRLFTSRYERWASPKFIVGESYGTIRAVGLAGHLQDPKGMDLNGLLLVSPALSFEAMGYMPGNILPFILRLPGCTAAAWYHKKLGKRLQKDLEKTLKEVEEWAFNEYAPALLKGDSLGKKEKDDIASKLAEYLGVSKKFVLNCNLRVEHHRFRTELLRDDHRTIGELDVRYKGREADYAGEVPGGFPPSLMMGPFMAAINDYLRRELKYKNDVPYIPINFKANQKWNWQDKKREGMGYLNVLEVLRREMNRNPYLRVFVGSGYYDLGTPYKGAEYFINQMGLAEEKMENISFHKYKAGHMMYAHKPSLEQFTGDVKRFYNNATTQKAIEID